MVGAALGDRQTLVVDNVLEFPGHIACDDASRSEVVIPIISQDVVVAGLDVDSPEFSRFAAPDVELLEELCRRLGTHWQSFHWY